MRLLCLLTMVSGAWISPLAADPSAKAVLDCTFKLFNTSSTATCFLIHDAKKPSEVYLLTSAHVLEKATGEEAILVLREAQEDGTYKRKDMPFKIREGDKVLWTKHEKEDIAAMLLKPDKEVKLPSLPSTVLATEADLASEGVTICSRLWMFGYPARLESNGAGFPVARNISVASYPLVPVEKHRTFMTDCSTFGGDSGGPVFVGRTQGEAAGQPMIVGIMAAQYRNDEKITMLHEERLMRHRLSLGKVLHAEFIRQTLEAAK